MPVPASDRLQLASRSPRRAQLLRQLGVEFDIVDVDVDETPMPGEAPGDYVDRIARAKACAGRNVVTRAGPILAADTAVSVDGGIFGKPRDRAEGIAMLSQLSGRWHQVYTTVVLALGLELRARHAMTRVEFARLDDRAIEAYWETGEPADKAGAYAIQGAGGAFIRRIEGCDSAVVGLPMHDTLCLLDEAGVPHALRRR